LQPGQNTLAAAVTLESGQSATATAEFMVAALPPQVTITGIQAGETITENRTVTVEADSQTAVTDVTFALDGQEVATEQTAPYTFELDVLSVAPGAHILTATAANTGGKSASADVAFMV
jgi:aerobic-type carbon monoxide dehydrogenase small subunit (CoxS/CutS family)